MANRISALHGHINKGQFGYQHATGIFLTLIPDLKLHQIAGWPESIEAVGLLAAGVIGSATPAKPGRAIGKAEQAVLRIEPLKWWLIGTDVPTLEPEQGATLDLSHSRSRIRISGTNAAALLNRLLPLDLRESSFPQGSVASSAMHHVGVTLWRNEQGYELFIPRGSSISVWQVILQTALQFGVEVF